MQLLKEFLNKSVANYCICYFKNNIEIIQEYLFEKNL